MKSLEAHRKPTWSAILPNPQPQTGFLPFPPHISKSAFLPHLPRRRFCLLNAKDYTLSREWPWLLHPPFWFSSSPFRSLVWPRWASAEQGTTLLFEFMHSQCQSLPTPWGQVCISLASSLNLEFLLQYLAFDEYSNYLIDWLIITFSGPCWLRTFVEELISLFLPSFVPLL